MLESLVKELSESENAVVQFNDLLHVQLINNAFIIVEPEKVRTLYEAAVTASENLYAKEMGLLVQQLDQRIAKYHATKTFSLWTVVIVLLFIAYLFFSFTLSLQRSIRQLGEVSQQLGEGRLTVRVPVETKDEFRYVMNAFNALADSFLQVVQEQARFQNDLVRFRTVTRDQHVKHGVNEQDLPGLQGSRGGGRSSSTSRARNFHCDE